MILRESGDQDTVLAATISQLRNNLELSKKIHLVADPDMKLPSGEPLPIVAKAKTLVASNPLPQLVGLSATLEPVAAVPFPASYDAAIEALAKWGIK